MIVIHFEMKGRTLHIRCNISIQIEIVIKDKVPSKYTIKFLPILYKLVFSQSAFEVMVNVHSDFFLLKDFATQNKYLTPKSIPLPSSH
jgi:hypothetical protein